MEYAISPHLPAPLPADGRGSVVTIGTFDGVHRGHREVLREIVRRAERTGRRSVLVTFHPHPLRIVRPEAAPPLLTTPGEKKQILAESGLEYAVFIPFTRVLQRYSADRFVEEILVRRLAMEELVVGYDHGFGRGREGDVETMRELGERLGFGVDVVEAVEVETGAISSTRIRRAVAAGEVEAAAEGLGRPYSLRGAVVRGDGRGRRLGFPTANIQAPGTEKLIPGSGVYAVFGTVRDRRLPGLLHLGPRPTFAGAAPSVELHLLDFDEDLYGETVRIDFIARLRGVTAFGSPEELVAQLHRDAGEGRRILGRAGRVVARTSRC
jgi:riboflavin kinase / FMN adenylyltransferase